MPLDFQNGSVFISLLLTTVYRTLREASRFYFQFWVEQQNARQIIVCAAVMMIT